MKQRIFGWISSLLGIVIALALSLGYGRTMRGFGGLVTFLVIDTTVTYQNTLQSINVAYDRTLLASAPTMPPRFKLPPSWNGMVPRERPMP